MYSGQITFVPLYSVLAISNVLGNTIVILLILKSRSMKTPINYLLLNLAVADLMVGLFVIPPFIVHKTFTHPRGLSGDVLCKILSRGNLAWASSYSSVFSLVFIAFERYYAIMKPLSIRHRITTRKLKIFIPFCWTIAVSFLVPQLYFGYFDKVQLKCRSAWSTRTEQMYYLTRFLLMGILPTVTMAVLYSRVINRLWFKQDDENNATLQAVRRSRKKVTKTMLTLSIIFVLCWLPDPLMHNLQLFFPRGVSYAPQLHDAFLSLIVLNSTVNPIVYTFQFEEFRKGLRKLFCCEERRICRHVTQRNMEHTMAESRQEMKTLEV